MAYQVIARKYRPQRFEDVVGQDHVTRTLSQAIRLGRIAHAYLFCGPRGTGKTTMARIFAKCLNCTNGPKTEFSDDDQVCQEIAEGRSLDVLEIDGASNRGIEEIRELRDTVRYAPASSQFKIYIIDEVHMLTKEAFNALLKTLEEPPDHAKFMFATTEPEKVLPTILSRCQRFDLRRIPNALIEKHLAHVASLEGVQVESAALQAVARGADGGMRDAESTLDQLISFCGESIVEGDVLSMFGMASRDQVFELARAMVAGDSLQVLEAVDHLSDEGKELGRLLSDLLGFFRNLMLFQLSKSGSAALDASEAEMAVLAELSGQVDASRLARLLEGLTDCDYRMKGASAKRIFFEMALMKAMEGLRAVPLNEVLKTLQSLRSEGAGESVEADGRPQSQRGVAVSQREEPSRISSPTPPETVQPAGAVSKADRRSAEDLDRADAPGDWAGIQEAWPKVLAYVEEKSPFTHSYLQAAVPLLLEGGQLSIGIPPQAKDHIALLEGSKNKALLREALEHCGFPSVRLFYQESAELAAHFEAVQAAPPKPDLQRSEASVSLPPEVTAPGKPAEPASVDLVAFRNDPLIKEALEVFKGQIVQTQRNS